MADTRSRRCFGDRSLKEAGIFTRSTGSAGTGKSAAHSCLTWPAEVSTSGPSAAVRRSGCGPSATDAGGGFKTTARPARRPPGTAMMSPRRSSGRERSDCALREEARLREASFSRSVSCRRIPMQAIDLARSSACCLTRRSRRAIPTTPWSAWNWAKEDSSSAAARCRPARPVRLTAML